jgi:hypothetical protein
MRQHGPRRPLSLLNTRIRGEVGDCRFGQVERPYPALRTFGIFQPLAFVRRTLSPPPFPALAENIRLSPKKGKAGKHLIGFRKYRCEMIFLHSGTHMAVYRFALNVT